MRPDLIIGSSVGRWWARLRGGFSGATSNAGLQTSPRFFEFSLRAAGSHGRGDQGLREHARRGKDRATEDLVRRCRTARGRQERLFNRGDTGSRCAPVANGAVRAGGRRRRPSTSPADDSSPCARGARKLGARWGSRGRLGPPRTRAAPLREGSERTERERARLWAKPSKPTSPAPQLGYYAGHSEATGRTSSPSPSASARELRRDPGRLARARVPSAQNVRRRARLGGSSGTPLYQSGSTRHHARLPIR